jgi:hypothetical protein
MRRNLTIVILVSLVLCSFFSSDIIAKTLEKPTPQKILLDQIVPSSPMSLTGDKGFCTIQSDSLTGSLWYSTGLDAGDGWVSYMDPAKCGLPDPYPFKITDVHFYLYGWAGPDPPPPVWPVQIQVNIRDLIQGYKCNGPGNLLCSQTYTIPSDSGYPNMIHLNLDCFCCVHAPFFLEIKYTGGTDPPYPSLFMTDTTDAPDTCDAWFLWHEDGIYYEWYDAWGSPVLGYPIMRITGYTQTTECESCWYWKPDTLPQAPSGMPDFDQNQNAWVSYCGPTAVANCLWWFDAVPEGWTPPQLIDTLAARMHCRPEWGTYVDTMQMALEQYFQDYKFALKESTFEMPNFYEMEDSLKKCQDIILLLGFWYFNADSQKWFRAGGHYVTMAGVCSESLKIALSDPDNDGAVGGAPGRVRPAGHPGPGAYPHTLHNDPSYVSQDIYTSMLESPSPGNPFWEINYTGDKGKYSGINVPKEFISVTKSAPKDDVAVYYTEVEYAVMICPKPTAVEEEEEGSITPKDFELYQSYPNPFNNETIIKYDLLKSCQVTLTIYNILGQKVKTLANERQEAGTKIINWDGKDEKDKDLASGIYFYQLKAGEVTQTKRMVLLK